MTLKVWKNLDDTIYKFKKIYIIQTDNLGKKFHKNED